MSFASFNSVIMNDKQLRTALIYNIIDQQVGGLLEAHFKNANARFQITVDNKTINLTFFFLNRYYFDYLKKNQISLMENVEQELNKYGFKGYKLYIKYRV
jgi:chemotaxis methyl-accepting protein methylase